MEFICKFKSKYFTTNLASSLIVGTFHVEGRDVIFQILTTFAVDHSIASETVEVAQLL